MTYLKFMRYSSLIYLFCFVVAGCGGGSNESGSDNNQSGSNTNEPTPSIPDSFTITTALLGRGTISPVSTSVSSGQNAQFQIQPESGYTIASVTGCGNGTLTGNQYSTAAITESCVLTVNLAATATTISGVINDAPVAEAKVIVKDAVSGEELGQTISLADGSYSIDLSHEAEIYALSVSGGKMSGTDFLGQMFSLCSAIERNNCNVTPYSSVVYKATDLYSDNSIADRYNKSKTLLNGAFGVSNDPFIKNDNGIVNISLIQLNLQVGASLSSWIDSALSDAADGYIDDTALQTQFSGYKRRPSEMQGISADVEQLKSEIATQDITYNDSIEGEEKKYEIVSFSADGAEKSGTAVVSQGYLSETALVEKVTSTLSDGTDLSRDRAIYLGFNRGQWKGQLNEVTTILTQLFMRNPQWLFVPDDEQVNIANQVINSVQFQNTVDAFKGSLSGFSSDQDLFYSALTLLANDVSSNISIAQGSTTDGLLQASVRRSMQELNNGSASKSVINPFSLLMSSAYAGTSITAKKYDLMPTSFRNITLQQQIADDGQTYLPNVIFRNNTSLYYALDKKEDFDSGNQCFFRMLSAQTIEPQAGGFFYHSSDLLDSYYESGKTIVTDVTKDSPLVLYFNSPCVIDQPTVLNGIAVVSAIIKAIPAVSVLGKEVEKDGKVIIKVSNSVKSGVEKYNKAIDNISLFLSAIKVATSTICDYGAVSTGDESFKNCQAYIDGMNAIISKLGGKIELIPQDDSESYQEDAKKLTQSLMKVRNITDVKNLLSAMSLSAAIKQELVVQIETSVLDIILGKNYTVDVKSHNKTYTLSNRDLAKHLIYKSSYKKLTSNQTDELYKREALYRAENKVIVALAKNKHRVALAFDRVKKLSDVISLYDTIYSKFKTALQSGQLAFPDQNILSEITSLFYQELTQNMGSAAIDLVGNLIVSVTPGQVVNIGKSANQVGAMMWDYVTKPSSIAFTLQSTDSGEVNLNVQLPELLHFRYLKFPLSSLDHLLYAPGNLSKGVQQFVNEDGSKTL